MEADPVVDGRSGPPAGEMGARPSVTDDSPCRTQPSATASDESSACAGMPPSTSSSATINLGYDFHASSFRVGVSLAGLECSTGSAPGEAVNQQRPPAGRRPHPSDDHPADGPRRPKREWMQRFAEAQADPPRPKKCLGRRKRPAPAVSVTPKTAAEARSLKRTRSTAASGAVQHKALSCQTLRLGSREQDSRPMMRPRRSKTVPARLLC